jgi:hypothetical protein
MTRNAVIIGCCVLLALWAFAGPAWPQAAETPPAEKGRDGVFEITLKGTDPARTMSVDELVRDRDLLPGYLFRVKAGGFLAFDESEWVDKIEFKVHEQPVTELTEYRRFASLLQDINGKISDMKQVLGQYDQLAMRMMDMCGRVRYPTLQAIDEEIANQLGKYRQLILLRGLVINSLHRFIADRSCRDKYADYRKSLTLYTKQLNNLVEDLPRLNRRAVTLAREIKKDEQTKSEKETGQQEPEKKVEPPKQRE